MAVSLCCLALSEFQQARHVILLTSHETAAFYKFLQIIIHFKHFFSHISHNIQTPPSAEAVNTFLKSRYQKINLSRDSEGDQCPLSGTHHSSLDVSGQETGWITAVFPRTLMWHIHYSQRPLSHTAHFPKLRKRDTPSDNELFQETVIQRAQYPDITETVS